MDNGIERLRNEKLNSDRINIENIHHIENVIINRCDEKIDNLISDMQQMKDDFEKLSEKIETTTAKLQSLCHQPE